MAFKQFKHAIWEHCATTVVRLAEEIVFTDIIYLTRAACRRRRKTRKTVIMLATFDAATPVTA